MRINSSISAIPAVLWRKQSLNDVPQYHIFIHIQNLLDVDKIHNEKLLTLMTEHDERNDFPQLSNVVGWIFKQDLFQIAYKSD